MKAILTRYLGPTNYRGSRIVATADAPLGRLVISYPDELGPGQEAHRPAAEGLATRLGWLGNSDLRLVGGCLPNGDYAWVFVYERSD